MLADRCRHPKDLESAQFVVRRYELCDKDHFSIYILGKDKPIIVPCALVKVDAASFATMITMPRWLAKNRELFKDNTPLEVEVAFP